MGRNWNGSKDGGSINRRDFMRRAAGVALGAAAAGTGFAATQAVNDITVNGLPGTVLGRTGLKITKISFGGILLTEPPVLLRAVDQGIKLVHTSPGYTNGRSMESFGRAFKKNKGLRDKVVFALKVRPEKLDECLPLLGIDYVDMIIPPMDSIHEISNPALRENFERAKKAGKVGHMGFACHTHRPEIIDKMVELGFYDVILMSYANKSQPFIDSLERARKAGIGILAMKGLPKRAFRNQLLEDRYWAGLEGNYCAMCGTCTGVCPEAGETLQRILRYRMYYKDYGLAEYARTKYSRLAGKPVGIGERELALCEEFCRRRLPLRQMVAEARELLS